MATRVLRSIESRLPGRFKEFSGYAGTRRAYLLASARYPTKMRSVSSDQHCWDRVRDCATGAASSCVERAAPLRLAVGASGLIPVTALHPVGALRSIRSHSPAPAVFPPSHGRGY